MYDSNLSQIKEIKGGYALNENTSIDSQLKKVLCSADIELETANVISSIDNYTKAIELYPYMGDAYFNRGLVLIYLKDKEKGCIDLSRAGELGVQDAYGVIKKYCEDENN